MKNIEIQNWLILWDNSIQINYYDNEISKYIEISKRQVERFHETDNPILFNNYVSISSGELIEDHSKMLFDDFLAYLETDIDYVLELLQYYA